jgi:hypothetical protein
MKLSKAPDSNCLAICLANQSKRRWVVSRAHSIKSCIYTTIGFVILLVVLDGSWFDVTVQARSD